MTATLTACANGLMPNEPMTEDTAFLLTDAGLDALQNAPVVPDAPAWEWIEEERAWFHAGPCDDYADAEGLCLACRAPAPNEDFNPGEVSGETDAFTPDTKEKADWVLGKIADARARAARIREHGEMMARDAEREAEHLEWKYGAALQDLARRETASGRRKSVTLYHGTLGFRTKPAGIAITDDVAALSWAKENAPAVVVEKLDKKALGDVLKGAGEVVPFATFTPAEEVFYIK